LLVAIAVSEDATQLVSGEVDACQPAINTQGVSDCSDALCGVGALLVAIAVSTDAAQLVSGEIDACQPAINTQGVGDCSDALCCVGALLVAKGVSPDATQQVSGEVDAFVSPPVTLVRSASAISWIPAGLMFSQDASIDMILLSLLLQMAAKMAPQPLFPSLLPLSSTDVSAPLTRRASAITMMPSAV
jgi:hypothetical protein